MIDSTTSRAGTVRAAALIALAALLVPASVSASPRPGAAGHVLYGSRGRLVSVPARGGTPREIAAVPASTLDIAASRNGKRIALIANRKDRSTVG